MNKSQWHRALPGELAPSNEAHVWRFFLDITENQTQGLLDLLSADEVDRARRFRFETDQKRFISSRGLLRLILGSYLGQPPHALQFAYTAKGKPVLAAEFSSEALCFNLSHAGSFALYAVTRGRNVGIDIEHMRDQIDVDQIAGRFFSPGEIRSLEQVHGSNRKELFFQYWTRKEALIKAIGEGLSFPLEQLDVSSINGKAFHTENSLWYIQDLFPGPGYTGAIALAEKDCALSCWEFDIQRFMRG
ncbi:MAG: 4'-phosphopantetheinyl transferase superfamily protein [Saprospiraceae bacterium]|nr:4'-phosphopantetheinyl transferase superfamily protein [Saprospiraceae bacterium]